MATKTKSFRLDDETWERFLALCQRPENKTDATKVLTTFIKQCLGNDRLPTSVEDIDPVAAQLADFRTEMMALINSRIDSVTTNNGKADESVNPRNDSVMTSNDNQAGLGSKPAIAESVETSIDSVTTVIDQANDSVDTRNDSVTTEDIETVSSSNVTLPQSGLEPIQSTPSQEVTETPEAIGNGEGKIAASGEGEATEGTEGAIELTPEQLKSGLPQKELAKRLGVTSGYVTRFKNDPDALIKLSRDKKDIYLWRYQPGKNPKDGLYFPISN